jgi:hypothetical protein
MEVNAGLLDRHVPLQIPIVIANIPPVSRFPNFETSSITSADRLSVLTGQPEAGPGSSVYRIRKRIGVEKFTSNSHNGFYLQLCLSIRSEKLSVLNWCARECGKEKLSSTCFGLITPVTSPLFLENERGQPLRMISVRTTQIKCLMSCTFNFNCISFRHDFE